MRKVFAVGLVAVCLAFSGCEEDGDTTVNEAPEQVINVPTNGGVIVVDQNTGTVVVNQTTSSGDDPSIVISRNTGVVFVATQPMATEEDGAP